MKTQTAAYPLNGILFSAKEKSGIELEKTDVVLIFQGKIVAPRDGVASFQLRVIWGKEEAVTVVKKQAEGLQCRDSIFITHRM